jgi:serine/threonine-protein kinase
MDRIGEYLVRRLVGEGGMGKVYEATERLTERPVALKVLRPELSQSDEGRRMFLNEMRILAQLEHPSVVRSLASFEADGQLVMVLELLEGRTLRQELTTRGRLPWTEAVEIVAQIAEALAAAHAHEIVHRDLKPENVMLIGADAVRLKVMDFGIAKVLEAARATSTQSLGTLQYMSPEQIDARALDARSDLYSLGLVFYEALSGAPPFRSASPRELLNLQCTAEPPPLSDAARKGLPRGVEALLRSLLEKDPAARPASATEVLARLAPLRPADGVGTVADSGAGREATTRTGGAIGNDTSAEGGEEAATSASRPIAAGPAQSGTHSARTPSSNTLRSARVKAILDTRADFGMSGKRSDTVALLEAASGPREISTPLAILLIVALSILAGIVTVILRARVAETGPRARADDPAASPIARTAGAAAAR